MMRITAVAVAVLALCFGACSAALGTTGHVQADSVGVFGASAPAGVAVLQSSGEIFATDPGAASPGVQVFDSTGVVTGSFAIGAGYSSPGAIVIDSSGSGDVVYVGAVETTSSHGAVLPYSTAGVAGTPLAPGAGTTFANPVALAVDPSDGTVYASALSAGGTPLIEKFSAGGVLQTSFDGSNGAAALTAVQSLAVDGAGRLYVSDAVKVYRYSAAGAYQLTVDDPSSDGFPVRGIAVDATSNEVYVNEPNDAAFGFIGRVRVFSAAGTVSQPEFATAFFGMVVALAVNETDKSVLTADTNQQTIERYTAYTGPTVVTGAGSPIDSASETLNGTINPEGVSGTTYHFEYGPDTSYGNSTPDVDPGSGSSPVAVSDTASGLQSHSTYHFRLVGSNPDGTIYGEDNTFTTAPGPPLVDGSPPVANPVSATGATLNGTVDPQGSDTAYRFEYGLNTSYGSATTPDGGPLSGQGAQSASSPVTGLQPGTTYHFRVVADNGTGGPRTGADQTFTTGPAAAASATDVTAVRATLAGVVNAHGGSAKYHFEYTRPGSPSPVTAATAEVDASSVDGDVPVTATSSPLTPSTTYTVRVVLRDINTGVTTRGAEGSFTTDPAPLSSPVSVSGVTTNAAAFDGSYDTNGRSGSYQFVIGSSTSTYLAKTDPVAVSGSGAASGALDKLPAGETYHVRLAVTSRGATTLGDAVTFSTAPQPPVLPSPPAKIAETANPYGCIAPVLAAYNQHPKPGEQITITGTDLGVGGNATLGTRAMTPSAWSANGFTITLPDGVSGSLPLTVNCGAVSDTIAIQIYQAPSNTFTATAKAGKTGSTVTVIARVPGPGSLTVSGSNVKTATKHAAKAGTATVKVVLTAKASKSLKRHHTLTVAVGVRFTPTGGTSRAITKSISFRKAGR